MNSLFAQLTLADMRCDQVRNIVSLCESQDLFDDLSADPAEWALAQQVEDEIKPPPYQSRMPIIDRPFEDAQWFNAITWPFKHWQSSRFSDGSYGVWYGCDSVETSVYESAYHWYRGLLTDAGFEGLPVVAERKVYSVACCAALLDLRQAAGGHPELLHPFDYAYCHSVGARIHREGHPGLLTRSVRRPSGENVAIFNPAVLSNPRHLCQLSYRLEGHQIIVEKQAHVPWLVVDVPSAQQI
jgi:hypothetical protein